MKKIALIVILFLSLILVAPSCIPFVVPQTTVKEENPQGGKRQGTTDQINQGTTTGTGTNTGTGTRDTKTDTDKKND